MSDRMIYLIASLSIYTLGWFTVLTSLGWKAGLGIFLLEWAARLDRDFVLDGDQ